MNKRSKSVNSQCSLLIHMRRPRVGLSLNRIGCLAIVVTGAMLVSCGGGSKGTPVEFVTPPSLSMDPAAKAPLAGRLTLATNTETSVSITINDGNRIWQVDYDDYAMQHELPVLGLTPAKTHTVDVSVASRSGETLSYDAVLTASTPALPLGFPQIEVSRDESRMEPGYTLFNAIPAGANDAVGAFLIIVDEHGEVVWYQKGSRYDDVRRLDNGNLLAMQGNTIVELNMLGESVRSWTAGGSAQVASSPGRVATRTFHHEVFAMDNGNFLVLSVESRSFDNYPSDDSDPSAAVEPADVAGDVIVEFAPDGSVVNEWSLLDMLDPMRLGYNSLIGYWDVHFGKPTRDWSHGNAVIHDTSDDAIIVSLRHQDAVIKFSRASGELIWILGPHDNWEQERFGDYLLTPSNPQEYFFPFHQHAPMLLPNGNLLLYDNGNYRASAYQAPMTSNWFSRAVEYAIDETNRTVELVWQYGKDADPMYYSGALGDADYLSKTGNVLITHGNLAGEEGKLSARIIEVTRGQPAEEVFQLRLYDGTTDSGRGWRIYRSERLRDLYTP